MILVKSFYTTVPVPNLCDHTNKLQALYKINKNASTNNRLRRMPKRLPKVNIYVYYTGLTCTPLQILPFFLMLSLKLSFYVF
jgi:hypothetical protein